MLAMRTASDHTSAEQLRGLKDRLLKLIDVYNRSPLGVNNPIDIAEILAKLKGMLSDHASDQKRLAELIENLKRDVDWERRGRDALATLTNIEFVLFLQGYMEQCIHEAGGIHAWELLDERERTTRAEHTRVVALRQLGQTHFAKLSAEEQRWVDLFIWAGCGMHKEMNAFKWGAREMKEWSSSDEAVESGAVPPLLLFNKDNAAAVADKTASTSKARAEAVSTGGGIKTTELAGAYLRHKNSKKGQQDHYRWFFQVTLGYIVQFPDTSNTRFGTFGEGAAELLVHLDIYLEFLLIVRDTKESGDFNHLEENLHKALCDPPTLTELAVLTLYSQAISHPYMHYIRTADNALLLGPYHNHVLLHCQALLDDPTILLSTQSDAYSMATLDGQNWEHPEAVYAVHRLHQDDRLPFLQPVLRTFLRGALKGWKRFMTEFAPGGRIATATAAELEATASDAANDLSEGSFGWFRDGRHSKPSMTLESWNAKTVHKFNNTDTWETAALENTPSLSTFVRKEGRVLVSAVQERAAHAEHVESMKRKQVQLVEDRVAKRLRDDE
ncbi:hypothetical protein OF83DRAFT_1223333, partial [Amylostereum chailletii]